jgi:hypothetical protein
MDIEGGPTFFARPRADRLPLDVAPEPAGSDGLDTFLDRAEAVLRPRIEQLAGPLVVALDVALPGDVPLLEGHDLVGYLLPLADRLRQSTDRDFVSVWGTKSTGERSFLTVAVTEPLAESQAAMEFQIATPAASETITFKKQVRDQLARALTLGEGPVALELAFEVGPGRDWLPLWKPTIDSLDPLLGPTVPGESWHPRAGRIVELGLHCRVEPDRGEHVYITVAPRVLSGTGG